MKVLILSNFGLGLYKFRKELIEELINQKYDVYISLPKDKDYVPKLISMGCKFIDTKIDRRGTNPINDLKLLLHYNRIIKNIKPDVVLTYTIKPNIYGGIVCRFNKIRYLVNITGVGSSVENKGILKFITLTLYKLSLKNASCVFFQNEENKRFFLKRKLVRSNHRLLPGSGVNTEEYSLLEYPKDDNEINFIYISRVMKEKGIEQYIEAAKYIRHKYSHTRFHILGFCEEEYESKLKQLEKEGIIQFHGLQKDVRDFLKISHCTIHPTYYPEGMSNVLLESAASGRPIITTNRSGCREIVNNGISGYLVEQENTHDLIKKIEKFIELPFEKKKEMGEKAREKIEKQFDRKIVVMEYMKEIRKIR